METKRIPIDCTQAQYQTTYASAALYRELKGCLKYGIIAALLLFLVGMGGSMAMCCAAVVNLVLVLVAIRYRNKLWALAAGAVSVLLMAWVLWQTYWWGVNVWVEFRYFGFRWIALENDWLICIAALLGGSMGLLCTGKLLKVFKKIDAEYAELMANLRT